MQLGCGYITGSGSFFYGVEQPEVVGLPVHHDGGSPLTSALVPADSDGSNPPNSVIDAPVAVSDNVWPQTQYNTCVGSGLQDKYRSVLPSGLIAVQDYVFPASASVAVAASLMIRSSGDPANAVWLAPAGTTRFTEGSTMTKASGTATSIAVPSTAGTYKLSVLDAQGNKLGESAALLRVK